MSNMVLRDNSKGDLCKSRPDAVEIKKTWRKNGMSAGQNDKAKMSI